MIMSYRDKFYSKYFSCHTRQLGGEVSLDKIRRQFPAWRAYFGRFLPKDKNAKILDLGCGNGGFVWWFQEIGYQNIEGIDISAEQIEVGRNLGIKNIKQADIKEFFNIKTSDVQNQNIDDNFRTSEVKRYDAIFMSDIIEHFNKEEVLNILELVFNVLKKNGILVIRTPNAESPFSGRFRYGDFTHEISFTEGSIRQILLVSGFKEIKVYPQRPVIHGLKSFIRYLLWRYIELELKFYLLVETGSAKGIFTQNLIAGCSK